METQQKFLSFYLGLKDTAVIPLQHIIEVFQISLMEICAVPQMPGCVLGTYNWRGEMLWVVDLEEMLGYTPVSNDINLFSKLMAIVLQCEGKSLGLLVRQLMDIELLDPTQIKYPESQIFSSDISPFIKGYFINYLEDMIISLDASAILHHSIWKNYN
ncbi:chemotaxis protein CheW [Scytonema hofmannii PCC 7110]|uniref:Chemotaxis protein CheW n=1 Tax=Scytonema hofmannii PCC 7110 TaxID=128403 RepID=A0A139XD36_9CYAN|nr:chemotaxis protein CheW [Scytonema hofmannii]KYC42609.1 chemotaxis protein CheW [Scytonema hofmannii PCC 7110]